LQISSNESFPLIGPMLFKFRYIIDIIDVYKCISLLLLSSEVKPLIFCEHKALL